MRPTMKAQHGNGRGSRSPFLTSYALTLAFITFVSVLYFKDFSSTLHRPFLHRPPPHPHRRPLRPRHPASSDSDVGSQAGRRAVAEQLPFAVGAAPAGCDVGQGEWVYDEAARPWYQEEECPYIQPQLTCQAHGRPDRAYQHWRWQPRGCVTTSAASDVVPGEETTEADEVVELSKGPGVKTRPKRTVKPNMKYIGPSWTNPSSKKAEA